jgi:hypothetical protein
MGVRNDKKVTPGITELSRPRAQTAFEIIISGLEYESTKPTCFAQAFLKSLELIDGGACYIDVGSSYPNVKVRPCVVEWLCRIA